MRRTVRRIAAGELDRVFAPSAECESLHGALAEVTAGLHEIVAQIHVTSDSVATGIST